MAAATTATTADSPFDRLSAGLLQQVLQGVPQRERLTQCALVSRAWAEAAALATSEVDCTLKNSSSHAEFELWLGKHAGRVRSLVLPRCFGEYLPLQLPWAQLQQLQVLKLHYIQLPPIKQPGSSNAGGVRGSSGSVTAPAPAPLLPALNSLELAHCNLQNASCLLQLASSPQLTSFKLCNVMDGRRGVAVSADLCSLLQQGEPLRVLHLRAMPARPQVLQHITAMQSLQDLELHLSAAAASNDRQLALPTSLTRLVLLDHGTQQVPQLQQLSSLQHLELHSCTLDPSALASIPDLRALYLRWCTLLPDRQKGARCLLRSLQRLTGLHSLWLSNAGLRASQAPLQLFSALTASAPQLTKLFFIEQNEQPLPRGCVAQHMFPAGRLLPQLQELAIRYVCAGGGGVEVQEGWCVNSGDLAAIVNACPALVDLDINCVVREDADVSALSRLPQPCRNLLVGGDAFDDAAASVICQLSQLTYLSWSNSPQLSDWGLQQLTGLQGLSALYMEALSGLSQEVRRALMGPGDGDEEDGGDFMRELSSSGLQGPVWQQLADICDKSMVCLRSQMLLQSVQIEAQQRDLARLQQQLAERDAQLADRDAQVQQLQRELVELRRV